MLTLAWIQKSIKNDEYYFSKHGDIERKKDQLEIFEVEQSISNGTILEQYENTGRGESCLVAGYSVEGKPIHTVIGKRGNEAVIITVYIPKSPKFKTVYERG